ncbi:MAG TPA: hypothetical protein VNZ45_13610 [Bacteroidia bacterium]|jgi:hypothetical protein|nr:hypothetical protein [Bacteroidia bacterium]
MTKDELYMQLENDYFCTNAHRSLKESFDAVIAPHLPDVILSKDEKEFEDWYKEHSLDLKFATKGDSKYIWMSATGK